MSILNQPNSYYWYTGAFCENCGILKGNVTYDGTRPIRHKDCKSDCKTTWDLNCFCPTVDYEKACAYRAFMSEYFLREAEILSKNPSEEEEDEEEGSFQGDNFDDCFQNLGEVAEPEQVLFWTTVDGKDYVKCEKTKTIYDFATFRNSFELVVLGKWNEVTKKIDFEAKEYSGVGEGEGSYLPSFNPHTETRNYRLA